MCDDTTNNSLIGNAGVSGSFVDGKLCLCIVYARFICCLPVVYFSFTCCLLTIHQIDWDELDVKLGRLQDECRRAMDNLRLVAKHETYSSQNFRLKLSEFLSDCAERIIILKIVHQRMVHRYAALQLILH